MLQDTDPLWAAIDKANELFNRDNNQGGGNISIELCLAMSNLYKQCLRDKAKEAKQLFRHRVEALQGEPVS
jgi:hypothetical protein